VTESGQKGFLVMDSGVLVQFDMESMSFYEVGDNLSSGDSPYPPAVKDSSWWIRPTSFISWIRTQPRCGPNPRNTPSLR
jgi:hypothetical protein